MPAILLWFLSPLGKIIGIVTICALAFGGVYTKGRVDGKSAYQAKLTRQLNAAIKKGNDAEAKALKKFDSEKELEDDGFERKD